jgi:hypothetical protein
MQIKKINYIYKKVWLKFIVTLPGQARLDTPEKDDLLMQILEQVGPSVNIKCRWHHKGVAAQGQQPQCQHFGRTCRHFQGMEMGTACSSKTLESTYNTTQYHSLDDPNLCGIAVSDYLTML